MVTIYDLAKYCGVSSSTVSKVLNNYSTIPTETKEKVKEAMRVLGYLPNVNARSLSKGKTNTVGILSYYDKDISPFSHNLFTQILDSFQKYMNEHNYELVFISKIVGGKAESYLNNCITRKISGTLLFGNMFSKEITEILDSKFPTVAFDYCGKVKTGVTSKNYDLSKKLADLVLDYGHKKIVYIRPKDLNSVVKERFNGFIDTLKKRNFPLQNLLVKDGKFIDRDDAKRITYEIIESNFNPSVIIYPDDYGALAGIRALQKKGMSVPNDISVTGYDGLEIFEDIYPRLTSVKQNTEQIGRVLGRELVLQMTQPNYKQKIVYVDGEIIVGDSLKNLNEKKI